MIRRRPVSLALVALFLWQNGCAYYPDIEPGEVSNYDVVRVTRVMTLTSDTCPWSSDDERCAWENKYQWDGSYEYRYKDTVPPRRGMSQLGRRWAGCGRLATIDAIRALH